MKLNFIILILSIFILSFQPSEGELRTIKGVVCDSKNIPFIGASIQEYDDLENYVETNKDGEFEINIPKKENVIIKITYGCSAFYTVLHEIKLGDEYLEIEFYSKKTDRKTKKIIRKLNHRKRSD